MGIIAVILMAIYLPYRYLKNQQRKNKQLLNLQNDFKLNLLRAEIINQEQIFGEVAGEMHDNIGQKLAIAKLHIMKHDLSAEDKTQITTLLQECMTEIQSFSKSLGRNLVNDLGLIGAMQEEIARLEKVSLFSIEFKLLGEAVFLTPTIETNLFRIFQEAVQNAVKHAEASSISIALTYEPKQVSLCIRDNGTGYDDRSRRNNGLRNMEGRARGMHGVFSIEQMRPGTQVLVKVPLLFMEDAVAVPEKKRPSGSK